MSIALKTGLDSKSIATIDRSQFSSRHSKLYRCLGKTRQHGRPLFIWQENLRASGSNRAIGVKIREKCVARVIRVGEMYSVGNIHHNQIAVAFCNSAIRQRHTTSSGTHNWRCKRDWPSNRH